ncbi:response regulator transcription factor [Planomicrobium sp. CPCC 101110]|uniref:response regulator transcription factor n=1 Tax=Planomicrobium sp. CPCC 101110 TaxID=2599619 RepID=UPI0011B60C5E|nr:response regulator transcription factor [Planomicrobium sp. CPCC 101110]TWT24237.1 response regulator transcription factor [Planomicrobium sp. CPCC 101110]
MEETCKVLIVDDEMLIRQGIINYIDWESEGFQIVGEASNGKEAMLMIEQYHPHIVVTDIVMPIMDGIDLVREGKKAFPDIEIIVLSSFEDFDYVRSTFQSGVADYILKPKLNGPELIKILNRVAAKIPNLKQSAFLPEPGRSTEEMLENLLMGYDSSSDKTALANVFANSHFGLAAIFGKRHDSLQLKAALSRRLQNDAAILPVLSDEDGATFLINFNQGQLEAIKRTIEMLAEEVSGATWILSEPFESIDDMKRIYNDSLMKMKKYLFYLPDHSVLIYDCLPAENKKQIHFDLNHFIDLFKDRLFNSAFAYLTDYVDHLLTQYKNDSFEYKAFLGNIIFNVLVLLDNMKYEIEDIERKKYSYFSNINEAANAKEALSHFNEFMEGVQTIIFSHEAAGDQNNNLDKMLNYIEQHYTEPLRLSEIANHFHFNPSYLSTYFSSHHKEGFSEYLNRVRIKKAMELLEHSTVSISSISEMVGYSEHSYFCKVFKKITGMSPGSYRKEYRVQNADEETSNPIVKR